MKIYLLIFYTLVLALNEEVQSKPMRRLTKRSVLESNFRDTDDCIKTCSINQKVPDANDDPNFENPLVQQCIVQKYNTDCIGKCPDSQSRTLLLASFAPLDFLCGANYSDLATGGLCIFNILESVEQKCSDECRKVDYWNIVPEVFTDFEGDNASNSTVCINENDPDLVAKNLSAHCRQEKRMIDCQRPLITNACNKTASDFYLKGYAYYVKSSVQIYQTLGIINGSLTDCDKIPS